MGWGQKRGLRVRKQWLVGVLAMAAGACLLGDDIIITEIMYRPASGDLREEYLELFNRSTNAFNLEGWQFTAGVDFTFPAVVLQPGAYLAVAADAGVFTNKHPGVTNVVGGWRGKLSDHGQRITLRDAFENRQHSVNYATQGDWGGRQRGPDDRSHRGWIWAAGHDGQGKSLELVNLRRSNDHGQNWASSQLQGGTPGRPNSVAQTNTAPLILDVAHFPLTPRATNNVTVTARILDESVFGLTVRLFHRVDGAPRFESAPMYDDGQHGDGMPADRVYGAILPPRPNNTVVEFYVSASDEQGNGRTWPAPVQPDNAQLANCLYQVDDSLYAGSQPFYRLITTEAERQELAEIGKMPWYWSSDAQMNATFISQEAGHLELRYLVGLRLRGTTTRDFVTKNRRVNFHDDQPWEQQRAINLNAMNPHSQVAGSVLCRLAGLPASKARLVQVRENNAQLAGTNAPPYGCYAELQVQNSDFARRQFPLDSSGNLYHGNPDGDLSYKGPASDAYRRPEAYTKETNVSEDDWSDLIELTRVLNVVPEADYSREVRRVANLEEWVRYFAVNTLLGNQETGLGTGGPNDYALYRGQVDPRFQLLIYDLDSVLGMSGGQTADLFRATNNPAIARFLTWPEFAALYFAELKRLLETTFAPANVNPVLDQFLGGQVPPGVVQAMKDFVVARNAYVLSQIPLALVAFAEPPVTYRTDIYHYVSPQPVISLRGAANATQTRSVRVSGLEAQWTAWRGTWRATNVTLHPGVNRLLVQALNAQGQEIESQPLYVWYDTGTAAQVFGLLGTDSVWMAEAGPYQVTGDIFVPPGVTLRIEPGASVFFNPGTGILVEGRLLAEGTPERHIRLTRHPNDVVSRWRGITFANSTLENRLTHLDMAWTERSALTLTNATLLVDQVSWGGTVQNIITTLDSSLAVRRCLFPNLINDEHVQGYGLPANGHMIFEGNTFGTTTGYQDIIDFTGGKRPGPIIQVLDNTFLGGSDDAVDLDGTDAHIEGNVFTHFHKNNDSTSESSAIATGASGGLSSELTVVRNVFCDNDYDIVLKEGALLTAQNNTFIGSRYGSLCLFEPGRPSEAPPRGGVLDGNIFWNLPAVVGSAAPGWLTNGTVQLVIRRSIFPEAANWGGEGNLAEDPRFANPTNDFHLRPGSPAKGAGPNGLDMGAYVPSGASLVGEPPPVTAQTNAVLTVSGPGITHYRWRLNDGPYGAEFPVSEPIRLGGLTNGNYRVFAIGKNSAGVWQPEIVATASRPWRVDSSRLGLRLNELLADNVTAIQAFGRFPDLVELYNGGLRRVDLSGMGLTDDRRRPWKFTFPARVSLEPGAYLVLFADSQTNSPGLHLCFGLDSDGESLFLFNRLDDGGELLDSVTFGPQLPDLSVGRLEDGRWGLTLPTLGGLNRAARVGDPRRLMINEWLANTGSREYANFIELYNPDSLPVDLEGLFLSDEPVGAPFLHAIPPLSFAPAGGFLVFVADGQADQGGNHLGFRLSSEQGLIGLTAADGTRLDIVAYGSQQPDVSQGRQPSGGASFVSFVLPTPGAEAASDDDPRCVVINEVVANQTMNPNTPGDLPDWIELYNRSTNEIDLAGLSLSDQTGLTRRWVFPENSVIPAQGFLVIQCDPQAPVSATNTGFGLNAQGDGVYLLAGSDARPVVLDGVDFGLQVANYSIGRLPDGTGRWKLNPLTPGRPNLPTAVGIPEGLRINEWMAAPTSGSDWFEIYNPGRLPYDLSGLYLTDNLNSPTEHQIAPLSFIGTGPFAYQVFLADDNPSAGPEHVGFKLSAEGDEIGLIATNGFVIDRVIFGVQRPGASQGRYPDGGEGVVTFNTSASPGRMNTFNSPPVLGRILDQQVAIGDFLFLALPVVDVDTPAQRLTFSLGSPVPAGLFLDATAGGLGWTPAEDQGPASYRITVVVTDNGNPPLSDRQSFNIAVTPRVGPRLTVALRLGMLQISWPALVGRTYLVEYRDDLGDSTWQTAARVSTSFPYAYYTTAPLGAPGRYYRVTLLP